MTTPFDKKISVIVTNYNHAQYIEQALDSLVKQTYQNLEVIIVDDKSTDNSLEVIKKWCESNKEWTKACSVQLLALPENKGKWNALNRGIEICKGELVILQDADDASTPQRIERQLRVLVDTKSYHVLCGFTHCWRQEDMDQARRIVIDGDNFKVIPSEAVTKLVHGGKKTPGVNHYYTGAFETHGASCLFYRQLWENGMRFLPGNLGLRCQKAEDSDFNTKMTLLLQKTTVLCEPLYCYRRNTSTNGAWLEGY